MRMRARPKKLRDGSWGAVVEGVGALTRLELENAAVTVTTAAGKSWDARIQDVIWQGKDGTAIVSLVRTEPVTTPAYGSSRARQASKPVAGQRKHGLCAGCGDDGSLRRTAAGWLCDDCVAEG